MSEQDKLKAWMAENDYSNASLARELNFTYDMIYALTNGLRRMTETFKFRFLYRFGPEEASKIFEISQQSKEIAPAL